MSDYLVMEPASTPPYRSVDLSEAVVLAGFLDFWNRWLVVVMAYCALVFVTTRSATALEIFAAAVVSYLAVRYPIRVCLLLWALLITGAAIAAAVYFAIKFVTAAFGPDSNLALIVPYAVVATFFWVGLAVIGPPGFRAFPFARADIGNGATRTDKQAVRISHHQRNASSNPASARFHRR